MPLNFSSSRISEASPTRALASTGCILAAFSCLCGCQANQPPSPQAAPAPAARAPIAPGPAPVRTLRIEVPAEVMTGLDVLESGGFLQLRGKRIGLLTHPAGADRRGESAIDVLRRAPGVRLVELFGTEHGIYDTLPASTIYDDQSDPRTGLKICSLYNGHTHVPTREDE